MLEGMKLSKVQAQKEIKSTDTTRKGTRVVLKVIKFLDSYQRRGEKGHRREKKY